ncbi:MAG: hypothetical protein EOQ32_16040 [Mesorhizobium sp.]|nr:hypothetical protein EJ067_05435 [Mesorhizobium sp. M1D.F.Ca.ET.043.01.1.1]RWA91822.1 MAG: hypothetical protein EOQ32_16040 [Mesorhizobium sp.]
MRDIVARLAEAPATADLPPCGGDVRQDRGGCEGTPSYQLAVGDSVPLLKVERSPVATLAGQHPPLSCRTSPPQGGRLALARGFANLRRELA